MATALPIRVYKRGDQGTFVYAPDISVYIQTDDYGVIDLSPYITNFTLQRNVNAPSTFTCSFDNKFARFDRVIRRMNRIVVFLKRIQWLQVFSGYISMAPWETVVPGDAMLMADCTLKRLVYTYWDPHSQEAMTLYPLQNQSTQVQEDGGAGAAMFRMLTVVANWDTSQIQIQKVPEKWLVQALKIVTKSINEDLGDPSTTAIRDALVQLLDADGWLGGPLAKALSVQNATTGGAGTPSQQKFLRNAAGGLRPITGVDQEWQQLVGKKGVPLYPPNFGTRPVMASGFVDPSRLANSDVQDSSGHFVFLRPDAAASLHAMFKNEFSHFTSQKTITTGYLSYDQQKQIISQAMKANGNQVGVACQHVSCPAGISDHGWGTAIDFDGKNGGSPPETVMNKYGWVKLPSGTSGAESAATTGNNHWVFVGKYPDYPAYISAKDKQALVHQRKHLPSNQFDWNTYNASSVNNDIAFGGSVFKTIYYNGPGLDPTGQALTGKRSWMNDVSLMESISELSGAAMRDFQSAPNGDFVAYFPDRLGVYGKFPAMQVRDIEIVDFKLAISDKPLVTHLVSVGDMAKPLEPNTGLDINLLFDSGYVTVEQPEVMKLILGLDELPVGLGDWIMARFGMRPQRQDNYNIVNYGFQWMDALHRFEEAWAMQWQMMVQFTFMPELFPGMRIELVDHGLSVYVESVVHQGSRNSPFTTQVMVSTPMRRDPQTGKNRLLQMEFNPLQFMKTNEMPADLGETQPVQLANGHYLLPNQNPNV